MGEANIGLPEAELYVYQADNHGTYQHADPTDESTAHLSGKVVIDKKGEI